MLERYHATRDPELRQALVLRYMPVAKQVARRYAHTSEPLDDLLQVASIGLLKAIDRFDPAHGAAFTSYAVPTILGELRRHFRDRSWLIRPPRDVQERLLKLERISDALCARLGRTPTTSELAEELGASVEEVIEAREAGAAYRPASLDQPHDADDDRHDLLAAVGADDDAYGASEDAITLDLLLRELSPREQYVLHLRFHEDLTQTEIAARVGLSQMHVSRLIRRSLERLRSAADR